MFNKIFTFKNIMFVLCVGIAIISTFFSCEVRAYSWEEFKDYLNDYTNQASLSQDTKNTCSWLISQFNWIENHMYQGHSPNDYSNFCFYTQYNGGKYWVYLIMFNNNYNNILYNSGYFNKPNGNQAYLFYGLRGGSGFSTSEEANNNRTVNNGGYGSGGLTDIAPNSNLNSNTYFSYLYPTTPPFVFTPYGFQLSGDSATYWNKFAYVSGFIPLGVLGDNEYFQLDIKLRDSNGYDVANYSDVPGVGFISDDSSIMKVENNVVYVNAIYLSYYRNYNLLFKVWDNSNDFETYIYAYQFMPFSAVVENGQIVSSGDTTFSGVDSTILITDNLNDYSNVDDILSGFLGLGGLFVSGDNSFSGDVDFNVSGDLFTLLGYSDYDNSYKDFIYNGIYHNLKDVFLSSNDREFTFLFMDRIITINSNSFTTPDGVLKTFVSSFLVFGTIYYFYKTTIHFYHKMQEGNQLEAVQTWSVDDESILM